MVNRYRPLSVEHSPKYKTLEEWAVAEKPNRAARRRVLKGMHLLGIRGRGGRLATPGEYNEPARKRYLLNEQVKYWSAQADRRRAAEAAVLEALEAEFADSDDEDARVYRGAASTARRS